MAEVTNGIWVRADNALAFDMEARRIRARFGWAGWGLYVGLLCLLVNQPGAEADVSDADGWSVLALAMGAEEATLRELVAHLAERGLADADALADGRLALDASTRAVGDVEALRASRSRAGKASAEARRRRRADG